MVGRLPSFWDDLFSGAMVGSGRIITIGWDMPKPCSSGKRFSHLGNPINLHYPKQLHCFGGTQSIGIVKPLIEKFLRKKGKGFYLVDPSSRELPGFLSAISGVQFPGGIDT